MRTVLIREPVKPRRWVDVVVIGVLAIILTAFAFRVWSWLDNAFTRPYSSETLRAQWSADGTLGALKSWTSEVLAGNRPPSNWPRTHSPFIYEARVIHDRDKRAIAVVFEMGGVDNHHGLVIGHQPESFWPVRLQWEEGVWWYDEVPKLDERSHRKLVKERR